MDAVILAAGAGSRMQSTIPKVLHPLHGRSMIRRLVQTCVRLGLDGHIYVVASESNRAAIARHLEDLPVRLLIQGAGKGTAIAAEAWAVLDQPSDDHALILPGDAPLIPSRLLRRFIDACRGREAGLIVFEPAESKQYGRVMVDSGGGVRIRESADCSDAERAALRQCNAGIYVLSRRALLDALPRLSNHNAQHEWYLPDVFAELSALGVGAPAVLTATPDEIPYLEGVNTPSDLEALARGFEAPVEEATPADLILGRYERLVRQIHPEGSSSPTGMPADPAEGVERYAAWAMDNRASRRIFVIRDPWGGDRLIATATAVVDYKPFHEYAPAVHVEDVVVDAEWRGDGLGRRLLERIEAFAVEIGAYKIRLDCAPAAAAFYAAAGFQRSGNHEMVRRPPRTGPSIGSAESKGVAVVQSNV